MVVLPGILFGVGIGMAILLGAMHADSWPKPRFDLWREWCTMTICVAITWLGMYSGWVERGISFPAIVGYLVLTGIGGTALTWAVIAISAVISRGRR